MATTHGDNRGRQVRLPWQGSLHASHDVGCDDHEATTWLVGCSNLVVRSYSTSSLQNASSAWSGRDGMGGYWNPLLPRWHSPALGVEQTYRYPSCRSFSCRIYDWHGSCRPRGWNTHLCVGKCWRFAVGVRYSTLSSYTSRLQRIGRNTLQFQVCLGVQASLSRGGLRKRAFQAGLAICAQKRKSHLDTFCAF